MTRTCNLTVYKLERVVQFFRPGTLTIVTIPGTETMANGIRGLLLSGNALTCETDFAAGGYAGRHASMVDVLDRYTRTSTAYHPHLGFQSFQRL